jgi:cobalt/nickel transport system permease protein
VLPKRLSMVAPAAGLAAFLSVPVASLAFVGLYAIGGTADLDLGNLATAMVGVHLLIGIGEGVITLLAVGSIIAVRPDLVRGARPVLETRELEVRTPQATA